MIEFTTQNPYSAPPQGYGAPTAPPQPYGAPNGYYAQGYGNYGYPSQNGGVQFIQAPGMKMNVSGETFEKIKRGAGSSWSYTPEEAEIDSWNFVLPDGNLALEIKDPTTDLIRSTLTGKEFHLIDVTPDVVDQFIKLGDDIFYTAMVYNHDQSMANGGTELAKDWGELRKLLPKFAEVGRRQFEKNQAGQPQATGYQGFGQNQYLYNGYYGQVPAFQVNMNSSAPAQNPYQYPPQGYQQYPPHGYGYQPGYQSGMPQPIGGTMMQNDPNANPFYGQPQGYQSQPGYQPTPSVPFQGAPTPNVPAPGAANPPIAPIDPPTPPPVSEATAKV